MSNAEHGEAGIGGFLESKEETRHTFLSVDAQGNPTYSQTIMETPQMMGIGQLVFDSDYDDSEEEEDDYDEDAEQEYVQLMYVGAAIEAEEDGPRASAAERTMRPQSGQGKGSSVELQAFHSTSRKQVSFGKGGGRIPDSRPVQWDWPHLSLEHKGPPCVPLHSAPVEWDGPHPSRRGGKLLKEPQHTYVC